MYKDYLQVNENFQTSINLELDLNDERKIREYIPTSDICDVIKKYVKSVLGKTKERSTLLVGPYGKGKSFLLLILIYLFSKNKKSDCYKELAEKIRHVDVELYDLIQIIIRDDVNLLPVIVNSNYDNVTQSFQIGLNEALDRESIKGVVPETIFSVCTGLIDKWNKNDDIRSMIESNCIRENQTTLDELKKGLKNHDYKAYEKFEKLYNCVNVGLTFNPLVSDDVTQTYSATAKNLKSYGYKGIFIVFDEFSKFLESSSSNLMKDLKIVQDMAETCSRTTGLDCQLHLCCVTQKPLSLYQPDKKQNNALDSFKTVEGRFKEIRFNRSIEENYQIISSAIQKKSNYPKLIKKAKKDNQDLFNRILDLDILNADFAKSVLFEGCYPLNPLTVYFLIRISEYCAQNERTLFTFLSDTDDNSFNSFVWHNDSGMFNVDKIYDYFVNVFENEDSNSIRNICYRCESVLSKLENSNERRAVKVLALILMINDLDRLQPTIPVISCSLGLSVQETTIAINSLINKGFIRSNIFNNNLSFAVSSTKEIDKEYDNYKSTKFDREKIGKTLDSINKRPYFLPHRYNEENKITRFFRNVYMTSSAFLQLVDFDEYFKTNYCDGVVISLINSSLETSEIEQKISLINDKRVIVRYPMMEIDASFYDEISFYECLEHMLEKRGIDDITADEIGFLIEECLSCIEILLDKYFGNDFGFYSILKKPGQKFSDLLSATMEECFTKKLIFNNELINKRNVTTQYQKAIDHVIEWLLNDKDKDFPYSETSAESSIKYSVLDTNNLELFPDSESAKNFSMIVEEIKAKIIKAKGKISICDCINDYKCEPYGIRNGILPIIFSLAISELPGNIILYYQKKEIELDATNIVKSITGQYSENYSIAFSKENNEQFRYLDNMMALFNVNSSKDFRKDVIALSNAIRRHFIGLPQILRASSLSNNILGLEEPFLRYKEIYMSVNINPYESLFNLPLEVFNVKKLTDVFDILKKYIYEEDKVIRKFKDNLLAEVRSIFNIDKSESLKSGFNNFLLTILNNDMPILDEFNKKIYDIVSRPSNYDDDELLNLISKSITNQYIDDWSKDNSGSFLNALNDFKSSILSCSHAANKKDEIDVILNAKTELTAIGSLLRNNLESTLEEYGDGVSADEKRSILAELLNKYI